MERIFEDGEQTRPSEPKVVVVVLNWNGENVLRRSLDSLFSQSHRNLTVVVVDNGSSDDSVKLVQNRFPRAVLITNRSNVGIAGRNPALLKALELGGEHMFVTDNDVIVREDTIARLVEFLEGHPDVGIVGPSFSSINKDGKAPLARVSKKTAGVELYRYVSEPTETECIGAAMVRRSVWENIGFYDPDYFAYNEDVDLCVRARRAGFRVYIFPGVVVEHEAASGVKLLKGLRGFVSIRSRCIFARKHFWGIDRMKFFTFLPVQVLVAWGRWTREGEHFEGVLMLLGTLLGLNYFLAGKEASFLKRAAVRLMHDRIQLQ